jgi:hypothetical protein
VAEENRTVLYDAPPIWAKMTAWVLLGVGIIVLLPIMLVRGDVWLLLLIGPLVLTGLVLLALRLRIALISPASVVRVTKSVFGLRVSQQQYPTDDVGGLELSRVAGDDRERDSDTWYLRLRLRTRGYTIGRYGNRMSALLARRDVAQALQGGAQTTVEAGRAAGADPRVGQQRESAREYYRTGMRLFSTGDKDGARTAFKKALALTEEPLLRRMIDQRLEELARR